MSAMASQITSVWIVCSTVCSGGDKRKHQSSASLAFVRGIHRWPVDSPSHVENGSIWSRHYVKICCAGLQQSNSMQAKNHAQNCDSNELISPWGISNWVVISKESCDILSALFHVMAWCFQAFYWPDASRFGLIPAQFWHISSSYNGVGTVSTRFKVVRPASMAHYNFWGRIFILMLYMKTWPGTH